MKNYKCKIGIYLFLSFCLNNTLENLNDISNSKIDEAISKYKSLAIAKPKMKEIDYNLGNLNYYKNEYDQAISHYNEALKTKDKFLKSNTHFNLGNTYYKLDDYEKSLNEYKRSLIANPNNDDARKNYEFVNRIIQQKNKENQQDSKNNQDIPTDYARQIKKQADEKILLRDYDGAYDLIKQLDSDNASYYNRFINRLEDVIN